MVAYNLTEDPEVNLIRAEESKKVEKFNKRSAGYVSKKQVKDTENKLIKFLIDNQAAAVEAMVENPEVFIQMIKQYRDVRDLRTKMPEMANYSAAVGMSLMLTSKHEKIRADLAKHFMGVSGFGPVTKNITVGTTIDPAKLTERADIFGATKGLLETFRATRSGKSDRTD